MRDLKEFDWNEAFNDNKGKTSIRLISGFLVVVAAVIVALFSAFNKYGEGLMAASGLATVGGTMLSIGRFTKDQPIDLGPSNTQENG
jgi:hypothetical protein